MLKTVQIENLRSFSGKSSKAVEIKPITVLVGKNSSGKSTFLRAFPLLRQSMEAKTEGPILWFGDYVDFGDFSEALNRNSDSEEIKFKFDLKVRYGDRTASFDQFPFDQSYAIEKFLNSQSEGRDLDVSICISVGEDQRKTYMKRLNMSVLGVGIDVEFEAEDSPKATLRSDCGGYGDIDIPIYAMKKASYLPVLGGINDVTSNNKKIKYFDRNYLKKYFDERIYLLLSDYFHSNSQEKNILSRFEFVDFSSDEIFKSSILRSFSSNKTFKKNFGKVKGDALSRIRSMFVLRNIGRIVSSTSAALNTTFLGVRYVAPLRATAERYYRYQDLQVGQIDHTGSNLAMVLRSLKPHDNIRFKKWMLDKFGFSVRVEDNGLHYALKIKIDGEPYEHNINDMGFGFSQLLPILVGIWLEIEKSEPGSGNNILFAIEQPELHLHPEYQDKISRLFCNIIDAVRDSDVNINFIFETHSKTMIDAIGDCIEDKIIDRDDVNIVVFDKTVETDYSTNINFSSFDDDGFLVNWPVGFFSARNYVY